MSLWLKSTTLQSPTLSPTRHSGHYCWVLETVSPHILAERSSATNSYSLYFHEFASRQEMERWFKHEPRSDKQLGRSCRSQLKIS